MSVVNADAPGLAGSVQRVRPADEDLAVTRQVLLRSGHVRPRDAGRGSQGASEISGQLPLRPGAVMQVKDEVSQPDAPQPVQDGVDRGALLGHEQDPLAASGQAGDQVSDRLRLAGSRRPVNDQVSTADRAVDGIRLAGVRVQHQELIRRRNRVGLAGAHVRVPGTHRGPGLLVTRDRADQLGAQQGVGRGLQILDHGQLGIREIAQHDPRSHREARDHRRGLGEPLEQRLRVGRLGFLSEKLQQAGPAGIHLVIGLEQVQQGRVDLPLARQADVEVLARSPAGRKRSLPQQHRSSRNRRPPHIAPRRHAPRQEQGLQAPFLEILRRLGLNRPGTPGRAADRHVAEQHRQPHRPGRQQLINSHRAGAGPGTDIESALLQVPVIQQGVPATQVDELTRPDAHRPADQANPARTCRQRNRPRLGHQTLPNLEQQPASPAGAAPMATTPGRSHPDPFPMPVPRTRTLSWPCTTSPAIERLSALNTLQPSAK